MLNYSVLESLFDEIMSGFSKEDIDNWLAFDAEREMLDRLQQGEMVITFHSIPVTKLVDVREIFVQEFLSTEDVYPLAA